MRLVDRRKVSISSRRFADVVDFMILGVRPIWLTSTKHPIGKQKAYKPFFRINFRYLLGFLFTLSRLNHALFVFLLEFSLYGALSGNPSGLWPFPLEGTFHAITKLARLPR